MMSICAKSHWYPSTEYRDMASRKVLTDALTAYLKTDCRRRQFVDAIGKNVDKWDETL